MMKTLPVLIWIFYSLWLVNWPGGRVDGQEGVPGVLGWAELDVVEHPYSFSRVIKCLYCWMLMS